MKRFLSLLLLSGLIPPLFSLGFVLWRNLKPSQRLEMRVIDDFEERVKWDMSNTLGIAPKLRFVYKNPTQKDTINYGQRGVARNFLNEINLLKESAGIHGRQFNPDQKFAQELIVNFNNPGYDSQIIRMPKDRNHFIEGRPIALSVWVYGTGKKHILYALFSNQVKKDIPVRMGNLNFMGWRRLEVPISPQVAHRNRINHNVYEFKFEGFKIASHPYEAKGTFLFLHDLVSVLVDTDYNDYAGSEIKDDWK